MKRWIVLCIGLAMYCATAYAADATTGYRKRTDGSGSTGDTPTASPTPPSGTSSAAQNANQNANPNANGQSGSDESTDCDALWRRYKESADCWGKFTMVGGAKRGAAALAQCGPPIKNPGSKCGPPRKD